MTFNVDSLRRPVTGLLAVTMIIGAFLSPLSAQAQAPVPPPDGAGAVREDIGATVVAESGWTVLNWSLPVSAAAVDATVAVAGLPTSRYNGYELPMQLFTVALPDDAPPATVQILELNAQPYTAELLPGPVLVPPALDWEPDPSIPPAETVALPTSPAFVVREGKVKGARIAVVAVSLLFEENGIVKVVQSIRAGVPGTEPITTDLATWLAQRVNAAAAASPEAVVVPTNPDAQRAAVKLIVSRPGMQEVTLAALQAAGATTTTPAKFRLTVNGAKVGLHLAGDRIRFFAPTVGDRWNLASTYWFTWDAADPSTAATALDNGAGSAGLAYERGMWEKPILYESLFAGPDGDHYFTRDLKSGPGVTTQVTVTIPLTPSLPFANGTSTVTATMAVTLRPPNSSCQSGLPNHTLEMRFPGQTVTAGWNSAPNCTMQQNWAIPFTTNTKPTFGFMRLLQTAFSSNLKIDKVYWEHPVTLNFGGRATGAVFHTRAGAFTFALAGLPAGAVLYDVTDPAALKTVKINGSSFNQANDGNAHAYALIGTAGAGAPAAQAHAAVAFGNVLAANAIYIGPNLFQNVLQPLLALRQQQGYAPLFVDVQKIFDLYGYGQISQVAVRNFLRAQTDWQNNARQISAVMVGDATYDPRNYQGSAGVILVPAYMEDVDFYIRETACEQCYAQLNGDDPRFGDNPPNTQPGVVTFFSADIWVGRFPVKDEAQLAGLVAKIVAYETIGTENDRWRGQHFFLSENYAKTVNAQNQVTLDEGGDFAKLTDAVVALFPPQSAPRRFYYDPIPDRVVSSLIKIPGSNPPLYPTKVRTPKEEWRNADPAKLNLGFISGINDGVGTMVYNGHSNHFNWAAVETAGATRTSLLNTADIDLLANSGRYYIGLSMTCYTSMFARPSVGGTLDEKSILLTNAGPVFTWGPSGLTVAVGHDKLQKGFFKKMWSVPYASTTLGALTDAGYQELLLNVGGNNHIDVLQSFLIMGDPLTKARATAPANIFGPLMQQ